MTNDALSAATRAVLLGRGSQEPGTPLNVPIELASNFHAGAGREYARGDETATWSAFEDVVGSLEGGRAVAFSSGMAAVSAVLSQFGPGTTIAMPDDLYQGVTLWVSTYGRGWTVRRVPATDEQAWERAVVGANLVWLESPTNPLLMVMPLARVIAAAKHAGAFVAVDNTFATPLTQRPLELGADVVVHSATKFIGGHSDLLAGVAVAGSDGQLQALRTHRLLHGSTPGALEMFLALRGLRTLPLRFERAQATARQLAVFLAARPLVSKVRYPGFGAVLSFELAGDAALADRVVEKLELIVHATSIGGVESTIERRAKLVGQEHVPPSLLRLSVGIEDPLDLERDLAAALSA